MIHTSKQLKDKVRNISKGDNDIAKTLIRNFMMERFLERISISDYNNNFILKGGMLVASIVGVDMRATMDIDTTVNALPLNENDIQKIISEICAIPVEDGVLARGTANTRLRDFYDVYIIMKMHAVEVDKELLLKAFYAICKKRESLFTNEDMEGYSHR